MIKRLALVVWWLGALAAGVAAACTLFGVVGGVVHQQDDFIAVFVAGFFVALTAALWAAAFVMGGSFWRPPR